MTDKPLLTIAVPTWNNFKQLYDCLLTLTGYTEFPYQIVVVNNGTAKDADGADFAEKLTKMVPFPRLRIHQADENLGWQRAINLVFQKYCETPLFCMLNDDVLFIPYHRMFWRQLTSYFRHPDVGAVGPCTNYVMGSQSLWDHRGAMAFETTLLIGFCMVVRSEAFSRVGGLDEGLVGGDDLDLSILLRREGYRLLVDRSCYLHHIGSQTGQRVAGSYWNTIDHVDATNNALIRKHGVRPWYDCVTSQIMPFRPITQVDDVEGETIREWIAERQTGLDIGCGHNKTVPAALGVDRVARGIVGASGGRKFDRAETDLVADASSLPLEEGSQEYVIARHVLEHLVDPVLALKEWHRVLEPGGVLAIACPDEDACSSIMLDWEHKHAFTPTSLTNLLRLVGFEVEENEVVRVRPGFSFALRATKPNKARHYGYVPRVMGLAVQ